MPDIDVRPTEVNISAYGGDTLPLHFQVDSAVVAGRVWSAQVRPEKTSQRVDATLLVQEDATGAYVTLSGEDSSRLCARGPYSGYWDVQLAPAGGGDPVTTLAYGTFELEPDVTRSAV